MSTTEKKFFALRDFKDAGTEKRFAAGKPVEGQEGELKNYEKAGLVTTDKSAAEAAASAAASDASASEATTTGSKKGGDEKTA